MTGAGTRKGTCGFCVCLPWKGARLKQDIGAAPRQERTPVQWYQTIFELIDMRSFSNLWYWIALAVLWSSTSHWVIGVPFDMITRARRDGGQAQQDLEDMVRINVGRILFIARTSGLWLVGIICFLLTVLMFLAFVYDIEFAQAVLFLAAPMTLVGFFSINTAFLIEAGENAGPVLHRRLMRHRVLIQLIGMVSIFVTAMFGMYQNMLIGVLG